MSVPANRMPKDPSKIMGLSKPMFYGIVVVGIILAYYIYTRSSSSSSTSTNTSGDSGAGADTTQAYDAGFQDAISAAQSGTPDSSSLDTGQNDAAAISSLDTDLQSSLSDLSSSISGLASAGVGPSAASATQPEDIKVSFPKTLSVRLTGTSTKKTKPKTKPKRKAKA